MRRHHRRLHGTRSAKRQLCDGRSNRSPGRIYDISYHRCFSQNANARQSLRLISGGGGNRKLRISMRIGQLREITGNPIPSDRYQNTRKSSFGKPFCQVAKSNTRRRREGRTWETCPPPRLWAPWPAKSFRAHDTPNRVSWRAPFYSCWHVGRSHRDRRNGTRTSDLMLTHNKRGDESRHRRCCRSHGVTDFLPGLSKTWTATFNPRGRLLAAPKCHRARSRAAHTGAAPL